MKKTQEEKHLSLPLGDVVRVAVQPSSSITSITILNIHYRILGNQ